MINNYSPSSMDLDIFLEIGDIEKLRKSPLEQALTEKGEPLGERKLVVRCENFESMGDGIKVEPIRTDPNSGWDGITAFEVILNEHAYSHLIRYDRVGSRHANAAMITIFGPSQWKKIGEYIFPR